MPRNWWNSLCMPDFADREGGAEGPAIARFQSRGRDQGRPKSENAEVAKRRRELLDQSAWAEFEARHSPRFAKVVGDGKDDRELFARIRSLKRNVELLNAVVAAPSPPPTNSITTGGRN